MKIGKRKQVTDLREIWAKETDFSDWLAKEDGLALIAEDIGVEVVDAKRESRPGDYPADIVGHALGDEDHVMVIENQFGKTNHDHLGKLLTYAAMHSAMTGIWISEQISNDHRKVMDWLNDNTPSNVSFYLAELKAYRIGDSPVAPQLDVVSRPNIQVKIRRNDADTQSTEIRVWREKFWEEILNYIAQRNPPFRLQAPSDDHWSNITIGRSDFWLALTLIPKNQRIGCELTMNPVWKNDAFRQLLSQRDEIEKSIGATLDWRELAGRKSARIVLEADIDPRNDENREKVKQWMYQQALAFYHTFYERVKRLQPNKVIFELATTDESLEDESLDEGTRFVDPTLPSSEPVTVYGDNATIEVVRGGVDKQDVDAIVNAANTGLTDGAGITGIIFGAAGRRELAEEIKRRYPNGTPTGTAVITAGHNLKQPYIIHTPGPVWNGGADEEPEKLAASYSSCLEVADANKLSSIAFCSISTGIYGYPLPEAASLAVKTVKEYLERHPRTSLRRVVFAMWGDKEYQEFTQALEAA